MATTEPNVKSYEHLIRLVRVARGLEAGGYYNAAKLFWAMVFSEELRASNEQGVPLEAGDLDREMQIAIDTLARTDFTDFTYSAWVKFTGVVGDGYGSVIGSANGIWGFGKDT